MQADFRRAPRTTRPTQADDDATRGAQSGMADCTVELELVRKRPGLWLVIAAGLVAAVVGYGVAGHLVMSAGKSGAALASSSSEPGPTAEPAVAVLGASEETGSSAENVAVRLSTSRAIGLVSVSVEIGGLVLGSTAASLAAPGEVTVAFPILRPQVAVEADVRVAANPAGAVLARAPIQLSAAGPVQVWRMVASRLPAGRARIEIEALAPAQVVELRVGLRSESGALLGEAVATPEAGVEDWNAAAAIFDLATFRGSTAVTGWTGAPMVLEIAWTNPRDGSRHELLCTQEAAQNWRWTLPARS